MPDHEHSAPRCGKTYAPAAWARAKASLDSLTHAQVLASYVERKDVWTRVSHGALLFESSPARPHRQLDVSKDGGGWWAVRFEGLDFDGSEPVRIHTRADLDAHVAWVAGEAG